MVVLFISNNNVTIIVNKILIWYLTTRCWHIIMTHASEIQPTDNLTTLQTGGQHLAGVGLARQRNYVSLHYNACVVLPCVVLCCTVLCCAVLLCCLVLCCVVLHCVVLCCTVLCCVVLHCVVLCPDKLCCVHGCDMLHCIVLSCAIIVVLFSLVFTVFNCCV